MRQAVQRKEARIFAELILSRTKVLVLHVAWKKIPGQGLTRELVESDIS